MTKNWILCGLVVLLSACSKEVTVSDCFAVTTGALIDKVVVTEGGLITTYSYTYDGDGDLSKVIVSYNDQEPPMQFDFVRSSDSLIEITDDIYTHSLSLNHAGCLEEYTMCYDSEVTTTFDFEYDNSMLKNVVCGPELTVSYEWSGEDISAIYNAAKNIHHEYQYTDIIDNFNIAIPQLTHIFALPFPFFDKNGITSCHLQASSSHDVDGRSSHRQLTYERNAAGDIYLIKSSDGKTWEVVYYRN